MGVALSLSAAVGFSLSGAGAGAVVTNTIGQNVVAEINDSDAGEGQDATVGNDGSGPRPIRSQHGRRDGGLDYSCCRLSIQPPSKQKFLSCFNPASILTRIL